MPTIFVYDGFRFFFYSNEGDPREPAHVHKAGGEAKFWVRPNVEVAANAGFDTRTLWRLSMVVESRRDEIEGAWHGYFG